jgi:hypothetical protein
MMACQGVCRKQMHLLTVHDVHIRADNGRVTLMPTVMLRASGVKKATVEQADRLRAWVVIVLEVYLASPTDSLSDTELLHAVEQEPLHETAKSLLKTCLDRVRTRPGTAWVPSRRQTVLHMHYVMMSCLYRAV